MKLHLSKIILPVFLFSSALTADADSILFEPISKPKATIKKPNLKTIKDFSFKDLNGKQHTFSEYKGKWIIVNYWATYCPPCRVEVTDLNMFAEDHEKTAVVLGMDAGGDPVSELKKFKQEYELSYTMAPAQRSTLLAFGIIEALPTTFIVSPQGKIVDTHIGMITYDDLAYYTEPQHNNKQAKK